MLVHRDRWGTLQIPETAWGGGSAVHAVNTLLGIRNDAEYLEWFKEAWGDAGSSRRTKGWLRAGTIDLLAEAARAFPQLPYAALAPLLARVEQGEGGSVEVPDLPTLAAWCMLNLTVEGSKVRAVECPSCERPWLASKSRGALYCNRPAPGKRTTCAQANKHAVFAARRDAWNREYRKVYARKLRGSVTEQQWGEWREAQRHHRALNGRGSFIPFESWVEIRDVLKPLIDRMELNKTMDAIDAVKQALRARARKEKKDG